MVTRPAGFLYALFFTSFYFAVAAPWGSFSQYLGLLTMLVYVTQGALWPIASVSRNVGPGVAYVVSMILSQQNAAVLAVMVGVGNSIEGAPIDGTGSVGLMCRGCLFWACVSKDTDVHFLCQRRYQC